MQSHGSVYFVSLGCPKNLVDSQVMLGLLERDRYSITQNPGEADVIIVNTCSFVQAAKEESVDTILEMADYKEKGRCQALVVSGCLAQRYSGELEKQMPEIDLMIGTGQYHRVTELLEARREALRSGTSLPKRAYIDQPAFIHSETDPRIHTGPTYTAFLKLSEGCNRRCAFCIIPKLRGDVRSRSVESLVTEAQAMASRGVRELNLVAQDLTHFGIDTKYRENLELLLPRLAAIDGIEWIRLHYIYPDQFSDKLIDIFSTEKKIVKYLDMPIQHTVDRMLRKMGRGLTKRRLFDLVSELRSKVPDVVFRTSIIVAFPSETEAEFEELSADLEALRLDHVGIFRYSKEEGTRAALMEGQIHPSTGRRREQELVRRLSQFAPQVKSKFIGKRVPLLIEGRSEETELLIQARMPGQAQEIDGHVLINDLGSLADNFPLPGTFIEAEITETIGKDYLGKSI